MSSIIFYGAGRNAYEHFDHWRENGLSPVCFVDASKGKQHKYFHTTCGEKLKILPLLEAIEKYPDYILYLTQAESQLSNVTEYLFNLGITKERIRYCIGFLKPTKCLYLEENFHCIEADVFTQSPLYINCCGQVHRRTYFVSSGNFKVDHQQSLEHINQLRQLLREGYYNICYNCSMLKEITEEKQEKTVYHFCVDTAGVKGGDVCNLKCTYCGYIHNKPKHSCAIDDTRYDILDIVQYIENNYASEEVFFSYAAGELGIQNAFNVKLLDEWKKNKWHGCISSNCTVFLSGVASLLEDNLIVLRTSLDSGTAKTFLNIKGADLFDRTIDNLYKYAKTGGGRICIKYIILEGINDTQNDMDSFLRIVNDISNIHPSIFMELSHDDRCIGLTEGEITALKYMLKEAKSLGLKGGLLRSTFSQTDIQRIMADNQ